jgi:hypothetical protein
MNNCCKKTLEKYKKDRDDIQDKARKEALLLDNSLELIDH